MLRGHALLAVSSCIVKPSQRSMLYVLQRELAKNKCTEERIEVWQRGVDTVRFNPTYRSDAMRAELSDGHPEAPLLVHVGRLGAGMWLSQALRAFIAFLLQILRHFKPSNLKPS